MIYHDFQGLKLSALGMGTMRLPVMEGDDSRVDEAAAKEMLATCMAGGVNYYDTAWGYHSGHSEADGGQAAGGLSPGKLLSGPKFPGYDLRNMGKVEEIFEKQLEKCRVDYFDFYLFHNVCEMNIDAYLDPKYGTYDYLMEQKRRGRIRHLGFSAHGDIPTDPPLSGSLRQGYGVRPDRAELFRLEFPECQGKAGAAAGVEHSRMGDGARARRPVGQPAARGCKPG